MKTLLLLINNYDVTKELIYYVVRLTKTLNLNLQILHVQNPHAVTAQTGILNSEMLMLQRHYEDIRDAVKRHIDRCLEDMKENGMLSHDVNFEHRIGTPSNILNEMLEEGLLDMVAVQSQIQDSMITSAQSNYEITKLVKCPIWVIPPKADFQPIRKAVYATDFQPHDLVALKRIAKIMEEKQIEEIVALHLIEEEDFHEEIKKVGFETLLKKEIDTNKISVKERVEEEDMSIAAQISEECKQEDAQLVIVLKENKNFIQRVFYKSFTKKLLQEIELPMLVLHRREEDN